MTKRKHLPIPELSGPELDHISKKVVHQGECWVWTGAKTKEGHGNIRVRNTLLLVHRVVWRVFHGPIPQGLELAHICPNPNCCRPNHLELTMPRFTTLRGDGPTAKNSRKTHCKRGHALEGSNVIERIESDGVRRRCRECYRARKRKAYAEGRYR